MQDNTETQETLRTPLDQSGPSSLTKDEIFNLCQNKRRRGVIHAMADRAPDEPIPLRDVADMLSEQEHGAGYRAKDRKAAYISLYQQHITKLEEVGAVRAPDGKSGDIYPGENVQFFADVISLVDGFYADDQSVPTWSVDNVFSKLDLAADHEERADNLRDEVVGELEDAIDEACAFEADISLSFDRTHEQFEIEVAPVGFDSQLRDELPDGAEVIANSPLQLTLGKNDQDAESTPQP